MADLSKWVHQSQSILLQGKLTHTPGVALPGEEEVEEEVLMAREVKKDPWEERLKLIA